LLFSPARHHTTPLSFPTRRSSDLQVIALAGGMVLVTELITDVSHSWLAVAVLALLTPLPFLFGFAEPPAPARRPRTHQGRLRLRDRKSTRLNSSHVSISYAVFCLK